MIYSNFLWNLRGKVISAAGRTLLEMPELRRVLLDEAEKMNKDVAFTRYVMGDDFTIDHFNLAPVIADGLENVAWWDDEPRKQWVDLQDEIQPDDYSDQ